MKEISIKKQLDGKTYVDKVMDEKPSANTLSMQDTTEIFLRWNEEHQFDTGKFLMDLNCILDKTYHKMNCFMLKGVSNGGKTYWMSPLFNQPHLK